MAAIVLNETAVLLRCLHMLLNGVSCHYFFCSCLLIYFTYLSLLIYECVCVYVCLGVCVCVFTD